MSTRIWIKDSADLGVSGSKELTTRDEGTGRFIPIYDDLMNPSVQVPNISAKKVRLVTYDDYIYSGFRCVGIYEENGATLRVENADYSKDGIFVCRQRISAKAPSVRKLRALYMKVRNDRTFKPTHDWSK